MQKLSDGMLLYHGSFGGMDLHILQKCTWQKVIIRKINKNIFIIGLSKGEVLFFHTSLIIENYLRK